MTHASIKMTLLASLCAALALAAQAAQEPLKLVKVTPLPGITGDFDHFEVDVKGDRLFLTAEDHHSVELFRASTGEHLKSLGGFDTPHSAVYVPESNKLYVSDGGDGTCKILNGDTYAIEKTIPLLKEADGMMYDAKSKKIFIAAGGEEADLDYTAICIVSTEDDSHVKDIKVDSKNIEAMEVDGMGRLFANIRDKGKVGIIDLDAGKVVTLWSLPVGGNTPLMLDAANKRLYVVGRKPGTFLSLDSETGKVMASVPCVDGGDDMSFDAKRSRFYVTGAEGKISVIQKNGPDEFKTVANLPTGFRGKNSIFVQETGKLYVAVSATKDGKKQAELRVYQAD